MITTNTPDTLRLLITPEESLWSDPEKGSPVRHRFRERLFSDRAKDGERELKKVLEKAPEAPEGKVQLLFASSYYAFIPEKLYEEELEEKLFERLFHWTPKPEELRCQHSPVSDDRILYWLPEPLQEKLAAFYPGYVPYPFIAAFQEQLYKCHGEWGQATVLAHLRAEEVDIGILQGKEQRFFNSFPCENIEELLYFLLRSSDQAVDEEVPVSYHLMGCRELEGTEERMIGKYCSDHHLYIDKEKGLWRSLLQDPLPYKP